MRAPGAPDCARRLDIAFPFLGRKKKKHEFLGMDAKESKMDVLNEKADEDFRDILLNELYPKDDTRGLFVPSDTSGKDIPTYRVIAPALEMEDVGSNGKPYDANTENLKNGSAFLWRRNSVPGDFEESLCAPGARRGRTRDTASSFLGKR
ncbi:hypothetical protein CEXT_5441 [Caerostris extrusa]|uniref:Uncharacterized protein n=1 Tax=Caerostris extrusa TaxID=172846 RepID=A0AAV4MBX0_CAEEX|nr:hypothetical protein CEXT_5441 [Caerostris extrusa]